MEDLLQAQFDNEQNLVLFDGLASFSINMLIHQINKSESWFLWLGLNVDVEGGNANDGRILRLMVSIGFATIYIEWDMGCTVRVRVQCIVTGRALGSGSEACNICFMLKCRYADD